MTASLSPRDTSSRLQEIERELSELQEQRSALNARWQNEKNEIQTIRSLKERIEQAKIEAQNEERSGNLARVAELRYGTIAELERELAAANAEMETSQSEGQLLKEEVTAEDIAEIVAKWTGIPVARMLETEREKLVTMEDRLHKRVIGQNNAIEAVANAVRRSRAGLQNAQQPVGSFIFLGTTGVGKTELARALAEFLFDDAQAMIRIDMSEYMEKHSVSRLIGAPPGYVGYEQGGQLTEAVRRTPYSVILLDEIEKAHPDVFNVLLQVLDDGRLTDSQGKTVDFTNTIVVMTSNVGTDIIQSRLSGITAENRLSEMRKMREDIHSVLQKSFRPEFLNRIDDIIIFNPLTRNEIHAIIELQMHALLKKVHENGYELKWDTEVLDWLADNGYNIQYGARPLKRLIQRSIVDTLALFILKGEFAPGDTIVLSMEGGKIAFATE